MATNKRLERDLAAISNPLAQGLVREAFMLASGEGRNEALVWEPPTPYRSRLRSVLEQSQLAQRLAAPELLPEPDEESPHFIAACHRYFKPRSYRHLLPHVAGLLWWYLEPQRPLPLPLQVSRYAANASYALCFALLGLGIFVAQQLLYPGIALGVAALAAAVYGQGLGASAVTDPGHKAEDYIELYHYLVEAYQDAPEGEKA